MLHLDYNSTKGLTFFLQPSLATPVYLLSLINYTTRKRKSFIAPDTSTSSTMLQLTVEEVGVGAESILTGGISVEDFGRHTLEVYEQASTTNVDVSVATFLGDDEIFIHQPESYDNPIERNILEEVTICPLSVSVNTTAETAEDANDGTATANEVNDTGTVTYLWDDALAQTTKTATALAPGIYTVIVSDDVADGCTASNSATVAEFTPAPTCNISIDSITPVASVPALTNGTATAVVTGNVGTVSYLWSDGQTASIAVGLPPGDISLAVSDGDVLGCIDIDVATIPNKLGNYLFLDGVNDKITTSVSNSSVDWTLQFEFKTNSFGSLQRLTSTTNSYSINIPNDTTIDIKMFSSKLFTVPTMSPDTWYTVHVVSDLSEGETRLYLNGVESTTGALIAFTLRMISIGVGASNSNPFGGGIDNFGISTNVATAGNISDLVDDPSLFDTILTAKVFYKFNESGTDATAIDVTGSYNAPLSGYVTGAPRWENR